MPVHPQVQKYLDQPLIAQAPKLETVGPEYARESMRKATAGLGAPDEIFHIEDRMIAGPGGDLRIRIYSPSKERPLPAIVFFHGGGWVVGSIESHDALARGISNACNARVISVDYRLSPEHPYPAAADDAYAAVCWVDQQQQELGLNGSLSVCGDSAGGNLSASVSLRARDQNGPKIACQVLLYPVTDMDIDKKSYLDCAKGYMLTRDSMIWYWKQYGLGIDPKTAHPYALPARATDLSNLPPAIVVTAEYDVLRDEAAEYAERLRQAGVPVTHLDYEGMIHGFMRRLNLFDAARPSLAELAQVWRGYVGD